MSSAAGRWPPGAPPGAGTRALAMAAAIDSVHVGMMGDILHGRERRAFVVKRPHAANIISGFKTWEVRNWEPVNCLKPGDDIDVIQCGFGKGLQLVLGTVTFTGFQTFTSPARFLAPEHVESHRWTASMVSENMRRWKRKQFVCWKFENPRALKRPLAIAPKPAQEIAMWSRKQLQVKPNEGMFTVRGRVLLEGTQDWVVGNILV